MQLHSQEFGHIVLPEQVMPLIQDCAGEDEDGGDRIEILRALASSYLISREKPTRIAFNHVSEVLAAAREEGFGDPEINGFLAGLEKLLRTH